MKNAWPMHATCPHVLFREQASATPDAIAVIGDDARLRYEDLALRVIALSRRLTDAGIGPEDRVGLYVGRTPNLTIGIHGILGARGAYVPLDPRLPAGRLVGYARDARIEVVVADGPVPAEVAAVVETVVVLDGQGWCDGARPDGIDEPILEADPADLAYVIFTSGSTGRPKGVCISRGALACLIESMTRTLGVTSADVMGAVAPYSFDLSVPDLFLPLSTGAALRIFSYEAIQRGDALADDMRADGVTLMQATPSHWRLLLEVGWRGGDAFRAVTGGEAIDAALARRLRAAVGEAWNFYGPTEATVWCSFWPIPVDCAEVLLGQALDFATLHVVDAEGCPASPGTVGELFIGGRGLARAYLGQPEVTRQRFVDWSGAGPVERVYRSGDLVRLRVDGALEFVGRVDHQVKIRGHRIELGEIEHVLETCPGVERAVVVARASGASSSLLGFVTLEPGRETSVGAILTHARRSLPDYMIPPTLHTVDAFPLSPNGKLDRRALLSRADEQPAGRLEPASDAEASIAAIWSAALEMDRLPLDVSVFDLGVDSLGAIRLAWRMRGDLALDVHASHIHRYPSVARMTAALETLHRIERDPVGPMAGDGAGRRPSRQQEALRFLQSAEPDSRAYNLCWAARVDHRVDPGIWGRAVELVLNAHPVLTWTFPDGRTVVAGDRAGVVETHDLSNASGSAAKAYMQDLVDRPFDLVRGPLTKTHVCHLGSGRTALLVCAHHIVMDGRSQRTVVGQLLDTYARSRSGQPPRRLAPTWYAGFTAWQARYSSSARAAADRAFWRARLGGTPHGTVPDDTSFTGPAEVAHRAWRDTVAPREVIERVRRRAREWGVSLHTLLVLAWKVTLDASAGAPVRLGFVGEGRPEPRFARTVGHFATTLVTAAQILGRGYSVAEAAAAMQADVLDALSHQDLPFAEIVREAGSLGAGHRDALRYLMSYQRAEVDDGPLLALGVGAAADGVRHLGLTLDPLVLDTEMGQFDLSLEVVDLGSTCPLTLRYHGHLFTTMTIERLVARFRAIVALTLEPVSDLDARVARLAARETEAVADGPSFAVDHGQTIGRRFAAHARRRPDHPALLWQGAALSYGFVDARANELAHALLGRGVGPGVTVGVYLERSPELVIALLAIQKAGGVYMPIAPDLPATRVRMMLDDAGPALSLIDATRTLAGRTLTVDLGDWGFRDQPATAPDVTPAADDAAYVIYTSGSTGRPKGVVNRHRGITNHIAWLADACPLTADDRVMMKTPHGFDVSYCEVGWALAQGATLVVAAPGGHKRPRYMGRLIREAGVTAMHVVPTQLRALVDAVPDAFGELRVVISAGEALPLDLVRRVHAETRVRLFNLYGPTEAAVGVSWWDTRALGPHQTTVPIGRPWGNTGLVVVDDTRRPVCFGAVGELMVTGCQVAPGYLHQPGLTAERFIGDADGRGQPGYLTGDLCRWLPDGTLAYLGRRDHQVKLRGFRIELGEIEAALVDLPGVTDAVVTVWGEGDHRQLVAHVVDGPRPLSDAEIRQRLSERLPDYMVPPLVTRLTALPLGHSGKVDRGALPDPMPALGADDPEQVAPVTGLQRALARIWSEVLGVDRLGIRTGFFAAGGHSLMLADLQDRLGAELGLRVSMADLLAHPTIEQLAGHLDGSAVTEVDVREEVMSSRRVSSFAARMKTSRPPVGKPPVT